MSSVSLSWPHLWIEAKHRWWSKRDLPIIGFVPPPALTSWRTRNQFYSQRSALCHIPGTWNIIISHLLQLISPGKRALAPEPHQNLPNHPSHMKMLSRFLSDERSSLLNRAINFREIEWSETIFFINALPIFLHSALSIFGDRTAEFQLKGILSKAPHC